VELNIFATLGKECPGGLTNMTVRHAEVSPGWAHSRQSFDQAMGKAFNNMHFNVLTIYAYFSSGVRGGLASSGHLYSSDKFS